MRTIPLLALLILSASIVVAGPCLPGSLQDYIDLGSDGCTIGSTLFSSFEALAPLTGATAISPPEIGVVPQDLSLRPTLRFDISRSVGPAEILQAFFQFNVSDGPFVAKQLSMSGSTASGDGVVTVVEELCLGEPFVDFCLSVPETLILFEIADDSLTSLRVPFAAADVLGVRMDIAIDGGLAGTAALASVTNTFEAFQAIPEPASSLVMLSGLTALFLARRRIKRANPDN